MRVFTSKPSSYCASPFLGNLHILVHDHRTISGDFERNEQSVTPMNGLVTILLHRWKNHFLTMAHIYVYIYIYMYICIYI